MPSWGRPGCSTGWAAAAPCPPFFGYVDPRRRVPRNNVLLVGLVALLGAFLLEGATKTGFSGGYQLGAEVLNFGALIAFMGVNLAAFVRYFIREGKRTSEPGTPAGGLCHLPVAVAEPQRMAKFVGRRVAGPGTRVRRLEDPRVPEQSGQLRLPD